MALPVSPRSLIAPTTMSLSPTAPVDPPRMSIPPTWLYVKSLAASTIDRRSGFPATSHLAPDGMCADDACQARHVFDTRRARKRLALPGTAFCSRSTVGSPARDAAKTGENDEYPPRPTTAETPLDRMRRDASRYPDTRAFAKRHAARGFRGMGAAGSARQAMPSFLRMSNSSARPEPQNSTARVRLQTLDGGRYGHPGVEVSSRPPSGEDYEHHSTSTGWRSSAGAAAAELRATL